MRKLVVLGIAALLLVVNAIRVELVAREPAGAETTIAALEAKVRALDERLKQLEEEGAQVQTELESFGATIEKKMDELKQLGENLSQLTDDARRRVDLMLSGVEEKQLEALHEAAKLGDEGVLLCGFAAKESGHDSVRRKAIETIAAMGKDGYPAVGIAHQSMTDKERLYLVEQLAKQKDADHFLPFVALAKKAEGDLLRAILEAGARGDRRLRFISAVAEDAGSDLVPTLIELAKTMEGDDGVLLLYAIAKSGKSSENIVAAVQAAVQRKKEGLPVLAAAYQSKDVGARAEVVRHAKKIGGELGQLIVDKALSDEDEALRKAAEDALND